MLLTHHIFNSFPVHCTGLRLVYIIVKYKKVELDALIVLILERVYNYTYT